ncbi:MAG TPA: hypothetical protein VGL53_15925 [Bryobacteraceae bacterium]|jgi:MFS family permease
MNAQDDMKSLWQGSSDIQEEKNRMWMELIEEKRNGFDRLVRVANRAEYVGALIVAPVLAALAWDARSHWVQFSYGLWAAAWAVLALVTWLAHRVDPPDNGVSLREHLETLIKDCDYRLRFQRTIKIGVSIPICVGLATLCLGIPNWSGSVVVWSFVLLLIGAFAMAQRVSYIKAKWAILEKRHEAERLLTELARG